MTHSSARWLAGARAHLGRRLERLRKGTWSQRLSAWWSAHPRARFAAWITARVALVMLAVELVYLVTANIILAGGLVEDWASGDDFVLRYDSAYSVLPGRAHVRNFQLRTSDNDIQIELSIEEVSVDVVLHELFSKRFRGHRVRTRGTSFKLRYKLDEIGNHGLRVAAYPEIAGYAGAPLREKPEPPETPTAEKAERWSVKLDDIVVHIDELWFVEYRFQGQAVATGAFELKPGLFLSLEPSKLRFDSGSLHVGKHALAGDFEGTLKCRIVPTKLEEVSGSELFGRMSAEFRAHVRSGDLAFANVYLEPYLDARARGALSGDIDVAIERGRVSPKSKAKLVAPSATLNNRGQTLQGDLTGNVAVNRSTEPSLALSLSSRQLKAQGQKPAGAPILRGLEAALRVRPPDVSRKLEIVHARVALQKLEVPTFAWFEPLLARGTKLAGSGTLGLEWVQSGTGPPKGHVELSLEQFSYGKGDRQLRLDASLSSRFEQSADVTVAFDDLELSLSNVLLATGGGRSGTWSAVAKSNSLRVLDGEPAVQGTFDVSIDSTRALLPLVLPDMPSSLTASLLGLGELETRLALYMSGDLTRIEVLKAESGPLSLNGAWQKQAGPGKGKFLLRAKLVNFGLRVQGGDTDVTVGADEGFLTTIGPS